MMMAKQLGELLEGENYCFFLTLDEETELYHVQSYIKTAEKSIFRKYLECAGCNPDNKVLTTISGMTKASFKRQLNLSEYAEAERDKGPAPIFSTENDLRCKYELAKHYCSPQK